MQIEREKTSQILTNQEFTIQAERHKSINEQNKIIGRKLHDDLSGSLLALKYLVNDYKILNKTLTYSEKIEKIEIEINEIYAETRAYSHKLIASMENELNYRYDIKAYLFKLSSQFNLLSIHKIDYEMDENGIEILTDCENNTLFFCLKECFSNAIKHANASKIQISITFNIDECKLEFLDNGTKKINQEPQGVGIENIKNYLDKLNGIYQLINTKGGTKASITFKMKNATKL